MIALFLELSSLQIDQIIHCVNIVKAVPAAADVKFSGEPGFQLLLVRLRHAGDAAGDAALLRIFQNFLQYSVAVTVSNGIGINTATIKVGKKGYAAMQKCGLLPSPKKEVGEGILTASGRAGEKNGFVVFLLG